MATAAPVATAASDPLTLKAGSPLRAVEEDGTHYILGAAADGGWTYENFFSQFENQSQLIPDAMLRDDFSMDNILRTGDSVSASTPTGKMTAVAVVKGDLLKNGKWSIAQLVAIARILAGTSGNLTREQQLAADLDGDGRVRITDLVRMAKKDLRGVGPGEVSGEATPDPSGAPAATGSPSGSSAPSASAGAAQTVQPAPSQSSAVAPGPNGTAEPSAVITPGSGPTAAVTPQPTSVQTSEPTAAVTPTAIITSGPTAAVTAEPTSVQTPEPTATAAPDMTPAPTAAPGEDNVFVVGTTGGAESRNAGTQYPLWERYGNVIRSYLKEVPGGFCRVEALADGEVVVERYSSDFEFAQEQARIAYELPKWGGCYMGRNGNFLVFGQDNPNDSDQAEVIRIVKYDDNWKRVASASVYGGNTHEPFSFGSLDAVEFGKWLYIRSCHTMYKSPDGANHQSGYMLAVDTERMQVVDESLGMGNAVLTTSASYYVPAPNLADWHFDWGTKQWTNSVTGEIKDESFQTILPAKHPGFPEGYTSHSFMQLVVVDGDGRLVSADLGDAYPRGIKLTRYSQIADMDGTPDKPGTELIAQKIGGNVGENSTWTTLGGLEALADGSYLCTYAIDSTMTDGNPRDVYAAFIGPDFGEEDVRKIKLGVSDGSGPRIVPKDDESGYIVWTEKDDIVRYAAYSTGGVSLVETVHAQESDCAPIWTGTQVVWYATSESSPVFYGFRPEVEAPAPAAKPTPKPTAEPTAEVTPGPTAEVTPGPSQSAAATVAGDAFVSTNKGQQEYVDGMYAGTVGSYLCTNALGGLTRVEYDRAGGRNAVVEEYDAQMNLTGKQTVPLELPLWGGFFAGERFNFFVFGQENPEQSDAAEVIRVVKYDKDWNRLGQATLQGSNITEPFASGSLQCAEYGDMLYIRTCRTEYTDASGKTPQSALLVALRQSDMEVTDASVGADYGGGHFEGALNQRILVDRDGNVVTCDQLNSHNRTLIANKYNAPAGSGQLTPSGSQAAAYVASFAGMGTVGAGGALGGFAEIADGYICIYRFDAPDDGWTTQVSIVDKEIRGSRERHLLARDKNPGVPKLVSAGLEGGYIMWTQDGSSGDRLAYAAYGPDGRSESPRHSAQASLSDCQPIMWNGKAVWYVTDNSKPIFYFLDAQGVSQITIA